MPTVTSSTKSHCSGVECSPWVKSGHRPAALELAASYQKPTFAGSWRSLAFGSRAIAAACLERNVSAYGEEHPDENHLYWIKNRDEKNRCRK
jgi:hypothetical protein